MEVITMESSVYKELTQKIETIEQFVIKAAHNREDLDMMWVDNFTVCKYLKISDRTLQRLRSKRLIAYSILSGKTYYTLGEIKRALAERTIKSGEKQFNCLMARYRNDLSNAFKK